MLTKRTTTRRSLYWLILIATTLLLTACSSEGVCVYESSDGVTRCSGLEDEDFCTDYSHGTFHELTDEGGSDRDRARAECRRLGYPSCGPQTAVSCTAYADSVPPEL